MQVGPLAIEPQPGAMAADGTLAVALLPPLATGETAVLAPSEAVLALDMSAGRLTVVRARHGQEGNTSESGRLSEHGTARECSTACVCKCVSRGKRAARELAARDLIQRNARTHALVTAVARLFGPLSPSVVLLPSPALLYLRLQLCKCSVGHSLIAI